MKKLTTLLVATILGTSAFAVVASQDDDRESRHQERMERRMQHMNEYLGLTAEQQSQIKSMYDKHHEDRKARREAKRQEFEALLTPEQREKWQQHREERKAKRCDRNKDGLSHERHDDDHPGRHHRES